eukprot:353987-Chlamydomonas_euryale.AAC.1
MTRMTATWYGSYLVWKTKCNPGVPHHTAAIWWPCMFLSVRATPIRQMQTDADRCRQAGRYVRLGASEQRPSLTSAVLGQWVSPNAFGQHECVQEWCWTVTTFVWLWREGGER